MIKKHIYYELYLKSQLYKNKSLLGVIHELNLIVTFDSQIL